jgi:hypothetical protein
MSFTGEAGPTGRSVLVWPMHVDHAVDVPSSRPKVLPRGSAAACGRSGRMGLVL